jgi:non-specific serine/threonine protein kinase
VWLVELAPLSDPALVPRAVGAAVGVREQAGQTEVEAVEAWLRDRRALLVLDNCEHLVEACAELVGQLLGACAGLRVLATSRESLALAGEAVWPVPALAVPARDEAGGRDCEATRLFADRASLAKPDFEVTETLAPVVAQLCQRLEGIPLAIELAAARVRALTVEQILERLDDRLRFLAGGSRTAPTRQQTLKATLDWSYELLTDAERALLRRLSVFAGGFSLEAAEAVAAGPPVAPDDLLDQLARLVDKSLVTAQGHGGETRYRMLEMIREYASDLLSRDGEEQTVRRRHAEYFVALSEESRRAISDGRSGEWLERMEAEHDNVRAALAWSLEHDPDLCLRLAAGAHPFRELRGYLRESRRWLETAVALDSSAPAIVRAEALLALARVAALQGDTAVARGFYEQGVPLAREAGDTKQVAAATYIMGTLANMEGDLRASRAHLEESLAIGRREGYVNVVIPCLNSLGEAARLEGDPGAARAYYEQAVAVARGNRRDHFLIIPLCNLGAVACEGDDVEVARACFEEALAAASALGSDEFISLSLDGLAAVAAKRGAWELAGRLAGAAGALLDEVGATLAPLDRDFRDRYLREVREHVGAEALEAALAEGRAAPRDRVIEDALLA